MTIPLPPLPEPDFALDQGDEPCYYAHTLRAIQREAMRVAIEAAAEECKAIELAAWREYKIGLRGDAHTEGRSDGAGECAAVLRALEIGT